MAANGFVGFDGFDGGPGKGNAKGTSPSHNHSQHLTPADYEQLDVSAATLVQLLETEQQRQEDSAYNSPGGSEKSGMCKSSRPHFPQTPKPLSATIGTGPKDRSKFVFDNNVGSDGMNRNGNKVDHQKICGELMAEMSKLLPDEDYSDLMDVKVSLVEKYNSFWIRSCRLGRKQEMEMLLEKLENALAEYASGEPTITNASVGDFLLVPNCTGQPGMYMCRAQVSSIGLGYVTVLLIDHGFMLDYPISTGLFAQPQEWQMGHSLRPLAIRARMPEIDYAFLPDDTEVFDQTFRHYMDSSLLRGTIQRVGEDGYADVSLEYGWTFKNLGQKLASQGIQRPKPTPADRTKGLLRIKPGTFQWKLKGIENAAVVYFWPEADLAERLLSQIKEDLNILLNKMPAVQSTVPQLKDFVGVRIDGEWFRGIIRCVHFDNTCSVFLMDMGVVTNVHIKDILPLVNQRAFCLPALALECGDADIAAYLGDMLHNRGAGDDLQSLNAAAGEHLLRFMNRKLKVEVLEVVHQGQVDLQGWVENDYAMINLFLETGNGQIRYSELTKSTIDPCCHY